MKICTKCNKNKELSEFNKEKTSKDGLRADCKDCCKIYKSIWNSLNREKERQKCELYYKENSIKIISKVREYAKANPGKINARNMKYSISKKHAVPKWLTESQIKEINFFYVEAKELEKLDGIKRHVDHIIPLQGETVSGLHVPWNLRIVTAEENLKKGNKLLDQVQ